MQPATRRYITAYAAYVAALHLIPGPWRTWDKGRYVDNWTLTHLGWSMIARRMGVPLSTLMSLAVANEGIEALIRKTRPDWVWGSHESATNVATDLLANYAGYFIKL